MSKTLIETLKQKTTTEPQKTEKQIKLEKLKAACEFICQNNKSYKDLDKAINIQKNIIKSLYEELEITEVETDNGKITISEIDKSYLDEFQTIEYLKANNLTEFIKTREYFDNAEIMMAISNGKINAAELNKFIIPKKEVRVNVKWDKT